MTEYDYAIRYKYKGKPILVVTINQTQANLLVKDMEQNSDYSDYEVVRKPVTHDWEPVN